MTKTSLLLSLLLLVGNWIFSPAAGAAERIRLYVAGPENSEQVAFGKDISRSLRASEIELDIRPVAGSPEALSRLSDTGLLQLALLQSDLLTAQQLAVKRQATGAERWLARVETIAALHQEDIYFVVRSDSKMNHLQDLAEARINIGSPQSGSALTAGVIYRLIFGQAIPEQQISLLPTDAALVKLITEKTIDAAVIVAPRPSRLLANMKPGARNFVKLLKFDATHPSAAALLNTYAPTEVKASSYPNLLENNLPILSVRMLLAAGGHGAKRNTQLAHFSRAWCERHEPLKSIVPDLSLVMPTLPVWPASAIAKREIRHCQAGMASTAEPCSQEDRQLGLCL